MSKREIILEYRSKINECMKKLRASNDKALEFAEGEISAAEYEPIRIMRRELRAAINAYEQRIEELKQ